MKKFYTITVTKAECKDVEKILKKHNIKRQDYVKTKVLSNGFIRMRTYMLLTYEETFNKIVRDMNGTRVF